MTEAHVIPGYRAVRRRYEVAAAFDHALAVLSWDADVGMPATGAAERARASGQLARLRKRQLSGSRYRRLLTQANNELAANGYGHRTFERAVVRRACMDEERERRIPASLAGQVVSAAERGRAAWAQARSERNWAHFAPEFRRIVALQRRVASQLAAPDAYSGLLDLYEPGFTTQHLSTLLAELEPALQDFDQPPDEVVSHRDSIPKRQQRLLASDMAEAIGVDLRRARIDEGHHPNTMRLASGDVRISTHIDPHNIYRCLRASAHESGHALYFQHLPLGYAATPLWGPASAGMNEAVARFWEVVIVGSRTFADFFFPIVERRLRRLGPKTPDDLHRGLRGTPGSRNRLDGDVTTYLRHIILRTRLEIELLRDELDADDVPSRWSDLSESLLGYRAVDPLRGPLQDIHWSICLFGYFPTYLIGTLAAYQLWDACSRELSLNDESGRVRFEEIHRWLTEHVYSHGRSLAGLDLLALATGEPLGPAAFFARHERSTDSVAVAPS